jgi:hypothetical protein
MTYREHSGTFEPNTGSDLAPERRSACLRRLSGVFFSALLASSVGAVAKNPPASAQDPVPTEPSIVEVRQGLAAGRFDVRTLERHYESRINTLDRAPTQGKFDNDEQTVLLYEFKDGLNRYLANRGATPRTLAELIAFNNNEHDRELPIFAQELFVSSQAKGPLSDHDYVEAHERAKRLAATEGIDAALAKDHLDALIAPTAGAAWTTDWITGDHFLGGGVSTAPAVAGYPHVTVPMGLVSGLPVGLSFVGTAWSEPKLIACAYAFEQASHARQPPHFTPFVP